MPNVLFSPEYDLFSELPKFLLGLSELSSLFTKGRFSDESPSRFLNEDPSPPLNGRFDLSEPEKDFLLLKSDEPPFENIFLGP